MKTDTRARFWLLMASVWWVIVAIGYFGVSPSRRWVPDLVGVLALICAGLFAVMALRPATVWAYRLGGTFAIGALLFHFASVVLGLFQANDSEAVWITLIWTGIALMLLRLFWSWWLGPVKRWHEQHRTVVHGLAGGKRSGLR